MELIKWVTYASHNSGWHLPLIRQIQIDKKERHKIQNQKLAKIYKKCSVIVLKSELSSEKLQ